MSAPGEPTTIRDCEFCDGYGDIWTGWHPTPVMCGHCHGTGKRTVRLVGRVEPHDDNGDTT